MGKLKKNKSSVKDLNNMGISKESRKKFKNKNVHVQNHYLKKKDPKFVKKRSNKADLKNKHEVPGNNYKTKENDPPVPKNSTKCRIKNLPLRERMLEKLKAAKFRYLNEQLYTSEGKEMQNLFKSDLKTYQEYHEGFRQQVSHWPINPVDVIIKELIKKTKSSKITVADFGCGDAKIAENLDGLAKVHSFDLVALNNRVVQCDMAHTQLQAATIDIAVFCLSLMGKNLSGYISEANRVLKDGGLLKIAEVESRFENIEQFIKTLERFGFKSTSVDLSNKLFYFLNFKKVSNISQKRKMKLPEIKLKPCFYKKR